MKSILILRTLQRRRKLPKLNCLLRMKATFMKTQTDFVEENVCHEVVPGSDDSGRNSQDDSQPTLMYLILFINKNKISSTVFIILKEWGRGGMFPLEFKTKAINIKVLKQKNNLKIQFKNKFYSDRNTIETIIIGLWNTIYHSQFVIFDRRTKFNLPGIQRV